MLLWIHTPSDISRGKTGLVDVSESDGKKMIEGGTAQLASDGANKFLPISGKTKTLKQTRKKKAKAEEKVEKSEESEVKSGDDLPW